MVEQGGSHQAADIRDPIWCAEGYVYVVWEEVCLCTSACYNDGIIASPSVELFAARG